MLLSEIRSLHEEGLVAKCFAMVETKGGMEIYVALCLKCKKPGDSSKYSIHRYFSQENSWQCHVVIDKSSLDEVFNYMSEHVWQNQYLQGAVA